MFRFSKLLLIPVLLIIQADSVFPDVSLPNLIGSKMVLQRDKPIQIWGWADPGEEVTVELADLHVKVNTNQSGKWQVKLAAMKAGGPYRMIIEGKNRIELTDSLIGEVWVCSGQSNMVFTVRSTMNNVEEVNNAQYPNIRLYTVPRKAVKIAQDDIDAQWTICTPKNIIDFSAVAYFFGRRLYNELGIPIGLINTAWGGTRIEPWTPVEGFQSIPELGHVLTQLDSLEELSKEHKQQWLNKTEDWLKEAKKSFKEKDEIPPIPQLDDSGIQDRQKPIWLYNGMVHPLIPLSIRGVIWYQGESNRQDGFSYFYKMNALILGWRRVWNQGEFPFYFVQLAPYRYSFVHTPSNGSRFDEENSMYLPRIREAQRKSLSISQTGMVVTTDIGNIYNIHPSNKQEVGRRLALTALAKTYGKQNLICSGPLYQSMRIKGNAIYITFDYVGSGLTSRDGKPLDWFEIADSTGIFVQAQAIIDGKDVKVWSPEMVHPEAVRFGWHEAAEPNLMNKEGLPASPYHTETDKIFMNKGYHVH